MLSYSSYNAVDKPIIGDAVKVSFGNAFFSFFAGFAVFTVVGYLNGIGSPVADGINSMGLAFVAYPTAVETLPGANIWAILLASTFITLGIPALLAMVEPISTVIHDTNIGEKFNQETIILVICLFGFAHSSFFCTNWGFTYFDTTDHYYSNYALLSVGILYCFGAAWVFRADEA